MNRNVTKIDRKDGQFYHVRYKNNSYYEFHCVKGEYELQKKLNVLTQTFLKLRM